MNIANTTMKTKNPDTVKKMYDPDMAKRFTLFRQKYISDNQTQAGKDLNCNQAKISMIEAGKQAVDFRLVNTLIKKYNLNAEWLSTGTGNPVLKTAAPKGELITSVKDLQGEIEMLKKTILIMQANQSHFIKVIERFMAAQEK